MQAKADGLRDSAPLCPVGHLPHEGGDQPAVRLSPIARTPEAELRITRVISPLVGEMSAKPTVGGAVPRNRALAAIFLFLAIIFSAPAFAVLPDEVLSDPALEARARALSANLRCLVCQNQSIDDSNADLARDLRILVRERLAAGDTDEQVLDFIVARYGEFVLLKPRLSAQNALLWGAPVLIFVAGALFAFSRARRRNAEETPLTDEERAALERLTRSG